MVSLRDKILLAIPIVGLLALNYAILGWWGILLIVGGLAMAASILIAGFGLFVLGCEIADHCVRERDVIVVVCRCKD